jgi:hypothetical protein
VCLIDENRADRRVGRGLSEMARAHRERLAHEGMVGRLFACRGGSAVDAAPRNRSSRTMLLAHRCSIGEGASGHGKHGERVRTQRPAPGRLSGAEERVSFPASRARHGEGRESGKRAEVGRIPFLSRPLVARPGMTRSNAIDLTSFASRSSSLGAPKPRPEGDPRRGDTRFQNASQQEMRKCPALPGEAWARCDHRNASGLMEPSPCRGRERAPPRRVRQSTPRIRVSRGSSDRPRQNAHRRCCREP